MVKSELAKKCIRSAEEYWMVIPSIRCKIAESFLVHYFLDVNDVNDVFTRRTLAAARREIVEEYAGR